jgi:hypothetical protein
MASPVSIPQWHRVAARKAADELREFASTLFAASFRPARFATAWAQGADGALNPLGFAATSVAIVGATAAVVSLLLGGADEAESLSGLLVATVSPYTHYVLVGLLAHGLLRGLGSRLPLRGSIAMALYAAGGPFALAELAIIFIMFLLKRFFTHDLSPSLVAGLPPAAAHLVFALSVALACAALVPLVASLKAVHRVGVVRVAFCLFVAVCATGLLYGALRTRAMFHLFGGFRLVLTPRHVAGGWSCDADFWF